LSRPYRAIASKYLDSCRVLVVGVSFTTEQNFF